MSFSKMRDCRTEPWLLFIPAVTNRRCVKRSFDCLGSALAYSVFQTLWFGFVGNDSAG
jgi:hypothetical protein